MLAEGPPAAFRDRFIRDRAVAGGRAGGGAWSPGLLRARWAIRRRLFTRRLGEFVVDDFVLVGRSSLPELVRATGGVAIASLCLERLAVVVDGAGAVRRGLGRVVLVDDAGIAEADGPGSPRRAGQVGILERVRVGGHDVLAVGPARDAVFAGAGAEIRAVLDLARADSRGGLHGFRARTALLRSKRSTQRRVADRVLPLTHFQTIGVEALRGRIGGLRGGGEAQAHDENGKPGLGMVDRHGRSPLLKLGQRN